jgi:hypothetical protein
MLVVRESSRARSREHVALISLLPARAAHRVERFRMVTPLVSLKFHHVGMVHDAGAHFVRLLNGHDHQHNRDENGCNHLPLPLLGALSCACDQRTSLSNWQE